MLTSLINRECTIVQRTDSATRDRFGNKVPAENNVSTVCELQQISREEKDQQGELSDTDWQAFFLPGEDLSTADGLIVDGVEYEFVGDPWEARNPRTRQVSHIEANVRKTAGSEVAS